MKKIRVQKKGWRKEAAIFGPFWYIHRGILAKGAVLLSICVVSLGIGIIPVWIYCGYKGNEDFYMYLKKRNVNISQ